MRAVDRDDCRPIAGLLTFDDLLREYDRVAERLAAIESRLDELLKSVAERQAAIVPPTGRGADMPRFLQSTDTRTQLRV